MTLTAQDLVGAWHLESWTMDVDGSPRQYPFGETPTGIIAYTADGWMTAAIHRDGRDLLPAGQAFRRISEDLLAQAYLSYFHYAGRYRIEGDTVFHDVTQSLNPNFVGTQQERQVDLQGDVLRLSGEEPVGGKLRQHVLTWHRQPVAR
ncbi:MAG: hypothetical protein Cons2KO_27590 [Congregibacter sp.]